MGTLTIIESSKVAMDRGQSVGIHYFDRATGFSHTGLSTSTSSARQQLGANTRFVTIRPDEDMYVALGDVTVEAGTSDMRLNAYESFSFQIDPGSASYIAAEDVA